MGDGTFGGYQTLVSGVFQQAILDRQLQSIYEALNPAELYRRLTELRVQLEEASAGKSEGFGKRAYRSPDIRSGAIPWGHSHETFNGAGGATPRHGDLPRSRLAGLVGTLHLLQ
jgi:hypothetical protein